MGTGNTRLVQILNNLREQMYRYRLEYIKDAEKRQILLVEHESILRAIRSRHVAEAKEAVKKAPAKKPAAKRTTAKKAVKPKMEVHFQFAGKDILAKSVLDQAVEAYKSTHKDVEIKKVELYIVAEEGAAYYVVNGEASDDFKVML